LSSCRERGVLSSRWGTRSPAGRPRNSREGNLRRMPGDRPMRRLRDPVRRTVRRLGWDVGAGTRRLGARTWPGAGGRTGSQRRPEQQGNRDPVTLSRPTCRWFCCRTMGRCRSGATGRAARPTAALADRSRRSSGRMSDLPDAVWVCAAATDEDPLWLACMTTRCSAPPLESEPRLLGQAEPASQERQVSTVRLRLVEVDRQGPGLLCRGPSGAAGTRAPHGDGTESPP
jgi:hypothetical protein